MGFILDFWKRANWQTVSFAAIHIIVSSVIGSWLGFGLAVYGWVFFVPAATYLIDKKKK